MQLPSLVGNLLQAAPLLREASASGNLKVLASFLGPAWRGLVRRRAKEGGSTRVEVGYGAHFDWRYLRDRPALARLYEAAKDGQWNATTDLDWSIDVDPLDEERPIVPDELLPMFGHPSFAAASPAERAEARRATVCWLLSQFLHGEQGALYAACQVTEAVPWLDAKLYGSSQVMDEGRHVEVFHRYLTTKLERLYAVNDNLYVIIDALMTDSRWDLKFLGMQIMIEGLALGAFGMLRQATREPLLRQLLSYVIADEARHVHYGVLALEEHLARLSERERREREDWAFEVSLLLRNRFLGHELYEEHYAATMTRAEWDEMVKGSRMMELFRRTMFKRIIPNLKRIGLLTDRIRPHYEALGLLEHEHSPAAPDLTEADLLAET